jgi:hypothetical protein
MLTTGLMLGLGTRWGCFNTGRCRVKLALDVLLTALVFVALSSVAEALAGTPASAGNLGKAAVRTTLGPPRSSTYLSL